MRTAQRTDPVEAALSRSLAFRFLALATGYPCPGRVRELRELLPALRVAVDLAFPSDDARSAVDDLDRGLEGLSDDGLEAAHSRLFGHAARGILAPYETEYGEPGDGFLQAHELADLRGFFEAAGLRLHPGAHERPDHVSVQCEFLQVLARREAHGLESGDGRLVDAMLELEASFLRDHLGRFGPLLFSGLAEARGVHGAVGRLAGHVLAAELARLDVSPAGRDLQLRVPVAQPDDTMICGTPPGPAAPPAMEV